LRDHLTDSNHEELLREATGMSKRQVQKLVATRFPKPDAPTLLRRLPERGSVPATCPTSQGILTGSVRQPPAPASSRPQPPIEPLSATRYKVQLTASEELKDKIAHATDLMRHANPSGDLAVVLERAVDLLIAQLEKERFGKTDRPRKKAPTKPAST